MKHLTFKNGDQIPILGLGTWKSNPGEVRKAIVWAIEAGYRHIDCAAIYQNEKEVGQGIADAIEAGLVKRKDLFITSKLWNNAHRHEDVLPAIQKTLSDLRLDYLDLYLIHWPLAFKSGVSFAQKREEFFTYLDVPLTQTWEAMQDLKVKGLAKHIGVSNFNQNKLKEIMGIGGQHPEMNQVEMHPFLPQEGLVNFCLEHGILMTAYSPLGSPDSRNEKHVEDPKLLTNPIVKEVASKHGVTEGQVLIAWSIAREIAVIPKSTNEGRIKENFEASKIQLDDHDMMELRDIGVSHRFVDGTFFTGTNSPYKLSDLWDS
ncbi:aldo/keto reductase [Algoriphagus marinus]|uniref:aldo/keto reductase n=1 Tax=Algoriphagus marinus TaxID=1925762 RepID=UPI00094BA05E|nr:aldo/keto reductase [Algoriphagus marinus]